jgi:uncharacterized protein YaaW (UPF0174 family)
MRIKSKKVLREEFDMAVDMTSVDSIATASIVIAGMTMAIGSIGPAIGEGWALSRALSAIAQPILSGAMWQNRRTKCRLIISH